MRQKDAENFIRVWQGSSSKEEAAEKLGLSVTVAVARAYRLRKEGVKLKSFNRRNVPLDMDALKKLADSLGGDDE